MKHCESKEHGSLTQQLFRLEDRAGQKHSSYSSPFIKPEMCIVHSTVLKERFNCCTTLRKPQSPKIGGTAGILLGMCPVPDGCAVSWDFIVSVVYLTDGTCQGQYTYKY